MYRAALRSPRSALRSAQLATLASGSRRPLSTAPASKRGTWKGAGLRWGLAAAAIYFYNTSPIFADELPPQAGPAPSPFSDTDMPTIDALIEEKRRHAPIAASHPKPAPETPREKIQAASEAEATAAVDVPEAGSAQALEQEAASEGAFNPETGEINWDCPCLGGMAHGPCGEQFKAAFSCFVYSTEEPKGMDCIEKFQGMQDCFRLYPDIYGAEIADDERDDALDQELDGAVAKEFSELPAPPSEDIPIPLPSAKDTKSSAPVAEVVQDQVQELRQEEKKKVEGAVPNESHNAIAANKDKAHQGVS